MEYIGSTLKPEHSGKKSDQSWGLKDEQNWAKWWSKHAPRYKGKTVAQQIRGTENSTLAGAQCVGEGCRPRWGRKVWQLPEHSGLVNCEGVTGAAKEFEAVGWQDQTCLFIKKKKKIAPVTVWRMDQRRARLALMEQCGQEIMVSWRRREVGGLRQRATAALMVCLWLAESGTPFPDREVG